ncbi:hypothetical protein PMAG_a3338 [Pseudoalteromonas mariniglutinosa NCIMB 1770]|nr:hypothetical protein [Pseudoalteromonas mariniglutinosa NCIMB 1770]
MYLGKVMEYQFIRDPISGLRIKISSEHAVIGRWLNEEIGKEKIAMGTGFDQCCCHKF